MESGTEHFHLDQHKYLGFVSFELFCISCEWRSRSITRPIYPLRTCMVSLGYQLQVISGQISPQFGNNHGGVNSHGFSMVHTHESNLKPSLFLTTPPRRVAVTISHASHICSELVAGASQSQASGRMKSSNIEADSDTDPSLMVQEFQERQSSFQDVTKIIYV